MSHGTGHSPARYLTEDERRESVPRKVLCAPSLLTVLRFLPLAGCICGQKRGSGVEGGQSNVKKTNPAPKVDEVVAPQEPTLPEFCV